MPTVTTPNLVTPGAPGASSPKTRLLIVGVLAWLSYASKTPVQPWEEGFFQSMQSQFCERQMCAMCGWLCAVSRAHEINVKTYQRGKLSDELIWDVRLPEGTKRWVSQVVTRTSHFCFLTV